MASYKLWMDYSFMLGFAEGMWHWQEEGQDRGFFWSFCALSSINEWEKAPG